MGGVSVLARADGLLFLEAVSRIMTRSTRREASTAEVRGKHRVVVERGAVQPQCRAG